MKRDFERNQRAKELKDKYGIEVREEAYAIPVFDEQGKKVADTCFMRWERIPWIGSDENGKRVETSIPIEDCIRAVQKFGLEIHRGQMNLLEAVNSLEAESGQ